MATETQCQAILRHLEAHGSITPMEALNLYGCMRLAARVADLREDGHHIETRTVKDGRKSWARYELVSDTRQTVLAL